MTTVNLSLFYGAGGQFFDNNGVPLAGGLLYTYQAGTSVNKTTYADSLGTIANPNPIVLDASGRVPNEIWLISGITYKFVLQSSIGALIGTWDNIPGANSVAFPITVAEGGTSLTSLPQNAVLLGNGVNPVQTVPAGLSGNVLYDNGTTWVSHTFTNNTGSNGYQYLPGGTIIQWGTVSATTGGTTFTFPISFPNAVRSITATANSGSTSQVISIGSASTTQVLVYSTSATTPAYIMAIGY